ncbi:MAG: AraC family transcriptional regulator [Fidelibacterota bacterium]
MRNTIYIKNMVCDRCIKVVKEELEKLGLHILDIRLGRVIVSNAEIITDVSDLEKVLENNGFELLIDTRAQLIENIKTIIIDLIQSGEVARLNINVSDYIAEKMGQDYHYLTQLFSAVESMTIEKYYILQKVEKAKELLVYDELTLTEIADLLGYSSVQYLSSQFKKVTGLTPRHFKSLKKDQRISLDQIKDR